MACLDFANDLHPALGYFFPVSVMYTVAEESALFCGFFITFGLAVAFLVAFGFAVAFVVFSGFCVFSCAGVCVVCTVGSGVCVACKVSFGVCIALTVADAVTLAMPERSPAPYSFAHRQQRCTIAQAPATLSRKQQIG